MPQGLLLKYYYVLVPLHNVFNVSISQGLLLKEFNFKTAIFHEIMDEYCGHLHLFMIVEICRNFTEKNFLLHHFELFVRNEELLYFLFSEIALVIAVDCLFAFLKLGNIM